MKEFLTAEEVAERLSVHAATVYRMIEPDHGQRFDPPQPPIPHYRIGSKVRIDPFLFENWYRELRGLKAFTRSEYETYAERMKLNREPEEPTPPEEPAEPAPEEPALVG